MPSPRLMQSLGSNRCLAASPRRTSSKKATGPEPGTVGSSSSTKYGNGTMRGRPMTKKSERFAHQGRRIRTVDDVARDNQPRCDRLTRRIAFDRVERGGRKPGIVELDRRDLALQDVLYGFFEPVDGHDRHVFARNLADILHGRDGPESHDVAVRVDGVHGGVFRQKLPDERASLGAVEVGGLRDGNLHSRLARN